MSKIVTVATVQHTCSNQHEQNLKSSETGIRDAAERGANLILLQELHCTLYFCQTEDISNFDLAETIPGPTTNYFARLASELNIVIVMSLFERRSAGIYHNTAVVMDSDGNIAGQYRKMHIPHDPGYYEKYYFTPGDSGFEPIQTSVGKLGVLICWDQWFPEAARLMSLAGADLLLYPTAIGWDPDDEYEEQQRQHSAWLTIQRAHAIANGIPVMVCNRQGYEQDPGHTSRGIQFWGSSFVAGPQGELLALSTTGSSETDSVLSQNQGIKHTHQHSNNKVLLQESLQVCVTEIDLARSETVRRVWPFLRDRRIDAYHDIMLRYRDK